MTTRQTNCQATRPTKPPATLPAITEAFRGLDADVDRAMSQLDTQAAIAIRSYRRHLAAGAEDAFRRAVADAAAASPPVATDPGPDTDEILAADPPLRGWLAVLASRRRELACLDEHRSWVGKAALHHYGDELFAIEDCAGAPVTDADHDQAAERTVRSLRVQHNNAWFETTDQLRSMFELHGFEAEWWAAYREVEVASSADPEQAAWSWDLAHPAWVNEHPGALHRPRSPIEQDPR